MGPVWQVCCWENPEMSSVGFVWPQYGGDWGYPCGAVPSNAGAGFAGAAFGGAGPREVLATETNQACVGQAALGGVRSGNRGFFWAEARVQLAGTVGAWPRRPHCLSGEREGAESGRGRGHPAREAARGRWKRRDSARIFSAGGLVHSRCCPGPGVPGSRGQRGGRHCFPRSRRAGKRGLAHRRTDAGRGPRCGVCRAAQHVAGLPRGQEKRCSVE